MRKFIAVLISTVLSLNLVSATVLAAEDEVTPPSRMLTSEPEDEVTPPSRMLTSEPEDEVTPPSRTVTERPAQDALLSSGACGATAAYQLTQEGTAYKLVISGTGDMYDYSEDDDVPNTPWAAYRNLITSVEIQAGITYIGYYAFADFSSLRSITIPEGVTCIEGMAFWECASLSAITLPASLTEIGLCAFGKCLLLDNIYYAGTEAQWNDININPFNDYFENATVHYNTTGTETEVPETSGSCGASASYQLTDLGDGFKLTISGTGDMDNCNPFFYPDSLWFPYASQIRIVEIEDGISSIGANAFSGCENLTTITVPDTVTRIGDMAFYYCGSLASINIPRKVISIGNGAFDGCTGLKDVYYSGSKTAWGGIAVSEDNDQLLGATIHYENTMDPDDSSDVTLIDTGSCGENASYRIYLQSDGYKLVITGTGEVRGYNPMADEDLLWLPYSDEITSVRIEEGITSIGTNAFSGMIRLTGIDLPAGVTSIGNCAFSSCTALSRISIPIDVTYIDLCAFSDCTSLKDVYYDGYRKDWENIFIDDYNEALQSATLHCIERDPDSFVIISQPEDAVAGVKAKVSFCVAALNAASYQWQYSKDGSKWYKCSASGYNTNTLSLTVSTSNAANFYRCLITGEDGTQQITEIVTVDLIPGVVINRNPQSNAVAVGEYAVFTVEAEYAASYQWQYSKDGAHWYNSGAEGNTTDTLRVKGEQKSQGNRYRCKVTGIDGNMKKSLGSAMIVMTVVPKTCNVAAGEMATFSLKAEGIESYQWQYSKDGGQTWYKSGAEGTTTDTVTFKATTTNMKNIYRCKLITPDEATAFTKAVGFAE